MGERCTIGTANESGGEGFVYLHWSSTPEEVTALTDYCAIQGYRSPCDDPWYGIARLCQTACNAWGNTRGVSSENGLSVGICTDRCKEDYGHYVLDRKWFVQEHDGSGAWCYEDVDWEHPDEDRVWAIVQELNRRQPEHVRIDGTALYCLYRQRAARRDAYRHGRIKEAYAPLDREKYLGGE